MKIAAFPKCYMDDLCVHRSMTLFDWIEMARSLGADGLEMYTGFFLSFDEGYLHGVEDALAEAGFAMPMLCCSPDFTHPDADQRKREVERECEMVRVTRLLGGPGAVCRVLTGQRYPEVSREQGLAWVVEAINDVLIVARECDVVLGLENHYKDGYWQYAEFAQKQDVFMDVLAAIPERRHFGVQYDPSNAIVAGEDPLDLLDKVADRVVSMHASDRYLAEGATLEDLRAVENTTGYATILRHGVVGQGLNDYDAIFQRLAAANYDGWVSIEDGMNGMEEMRQSIDFLKHMRARHFSEK